MPAKHLHRINEGGTSSHIYNKAVDKRFLFADDEDYHTFLSFLRDYLSPKDPISSKKAFQVKGQTFQGVPHQPKNYHNSVELISYNLMPDHFHLVLKQLSVGSLEHFVRSLLTRYSIYYNKKYHRSGSLFEGPYKSDQIKTDSELSSLISFLHQPVGISSASDYTGTTNNGWVNKTTALSLFKSADEYKKFVKSFPQNKHAQKSIENICFDGLRAHLERSLLASIEAEQELAESFRSRMPEFLLTATVLLLILVALSFRHIQTTLAQTDHTISTSSSPTSDNTLGEQNSTPEATFSPVLDLQEESSSGALPREATDEAKLVPIVKIVTESKSSKINIRQEPTSSSKKIGQTEDGETFETASKVPGWYEVKLSDGTTGFISDKYISMEVNQ